MGVEGSGRVDGEVRKYLVSKIEISQVLSFLVLWKVTDLLGMLLSSSYLLDLQFLVCLALSLMSFRPTNWICCLIKFLLRIGLCTLSCVLARVSGGRSNNKNSPDPILCLMSACICVVWTHYKRGKFYEWREIIDRRRKEERGGKQGSFSWVFLRFLCWFLGWWN